MPAGYTTLRAPAADGRDAAPQRRGAIGRV